MNWKPNIDLEMWGGNIWCREGNALPDRTIQLLKETNVCLFGAITSKNADEALQELGPSLTGKGLKYRSPIVQVRQLFDLYVNLRPCKAFAGNPSELSRRDRFGNLPGEHRRPLCGVEFHPLPSEVRKVLERTPRGYEAIFP